MKKNKSFNLIFLDLLRQRNTSLSSFREKSTSYQTKATILDTIEKEKSQINKKLLENILTIECPKQKYLSSLTKIFYPNKIGFHKRNLSDISQIYTNNNNKKFI